MAKIFLNRDVTIFRSAEFTILRTPGLVLRFFEPHMSQALCDITSALAKGLDQQFLVQSFNNRYSAAEIEKIFEVLNRYNLIDNKNQQKSGYEQLSHTFAVRGSLLMDEVQQAVSNWPEAKIIDLCRDSSRIAEESEIETLSDEVLPVFLIEGYQREVLEKLNRFFVKRQRDWFLAFRFFEDIFIMPFRKGASPCFACLPPLSISERVVDSMVVASSSEYDASARLTATSAIIRELSRIRAYESDSYLHILKLDPNTGNTHRILRIRDPLCPCCGYGGVA